MTLGVTINWHRLQLVMQLIHIPVLLEVGQEDCPFVLWLGRSLCNIMAPGRFHTTIACAWAGGPGHRPFQSGYSSRMISKIAPLPGRLTPHSVQSQRAKLIFEYNRKLYGRPNCEFRVGSGERSLRRLRRREIWAASHPVFSWGLWVP